MRGTNTQGRKARSTDRCNLKLIGHSVEKNPALCVIETDPTGHMV